MDRADALRTLGADPDLRGHPLRLLLILASELDVRTFRHLKQRYLAEVLGTQQPNVSRALQVLIDKQLLQRGPRDGNGATYRLNSEDRLISSLAGLHGPAHTAR